MGEQKKDGEPVILHVKVDGQKLVLGILSPENNPQLSFDLVFEKDFEVSHNWKNGSVHLLGYQSEFQDEGYPFQKSNLYLLYMASHFDKLSWVTKAMICVSRTMSLEGSVLEMHCEKYEIVLEWSLLLPMPWVRSED